MGKSEEERSAIVSESASDSAGDPNGKKAKGRDPNAPKAPRAAWCFFKSDPRVIRKIRNANPSLAPSGMWAKAGEMWKTMGPKQKDKYNKMQMEDAARFRREMKAYERRVKKEQALATEVDGLDDAEADASRDKGGDGCGSESGSSGGGGETLAIDTAEGSAASAVAAAAVAVRPKRARRTRIKGDAEESDDPVDMLLRAAKQGDYEAVSKLVEVDKVPPNFEVLVAAVVQGGVSITKVLLDRDSSLTHLCDKTNGWTVLHTAAALGRDAIMAAVSEAADEHQLSWRLPLPHGKSGAKGWVPLIDRADHKGMTPVGRPHPLQHPRPRQHPD